MYEKRVEQPEEKSGISPSLIALIVVGVLAVIFILQNGESKRIDFLMLDFSAPTWVVLLLAIAVGVLLDRLFMYWRRRRRSRSSE